jgi:hypothetical protein
LVTEATKPDSKRILGGEPDESRGVGGTTLTPERWRWDPHNFPGPDQPTITAPSIAIRELTAGDRDHIIDLFEQLSDFDRYLRFFRTMPTYPASVLNALTAIDRHNHVAVGAFVDGTCVGVIRYVRLSRRPTTAEVAGTVSSGFHSASPCVSTRARWLGLAPSVPMTVKRLPVGLLRDGAGPDQPSSFSSVPRNLNA